MRAAPLFFLILITLQTPACAARYFAASNIPATMIDPPPAVHSPAWNADIERIIALQQQADPAQLAKARAERDINAEMITLAVDPSLTRERFPVLYALLDKVRGTTKFVTFNAKHYWNTKRPYLMDTRVKALINAHENPAYPSGHTSSGYTWAYTLGMVIPAKREAFLARAEEFGQNRVLVGMHYPHDVAGGRNLALLIMGGLLQTADFTSDVIAAKAEYKKIQGTEN